MFTGIVEHLGKVIDIVERDFSESGGKGFSITIGDAAAILGDCHLGDSIAVNGNYHVLSFSLFSPDEAPCCISYCIHGAGGKVSF
jgi:riboflavin synthase alpha subunit